MMRRERTEGTIVDVRLKVVLGQTLFFEDPAQQRAKQTRYVSFKHSRSWKTVRKGMCESDLCCYEWVGQSLAMSGTGLVRAMACRGKRQIDV